EKGRDVGGADVVEVAGDAERFRGPLSTALCRIHPPAHEDQRNDDRQSDQNRKLESPAKTKQKFSSPRRNDDSHQLATAVGEQGVTESGRAVPSGRHVT